MAFRGQGKWIENPNVPYTHWQEPATPTVHQHQYNPVNTGVSRDYEGGGRWVPSGSGIIAPIVAGAVSRTLRVRKTRKEAERKEEMKWRAPHSRGYAVPTAPRDDNDATPTAPFATPPVAGTGVSTPFGEPRTDVKPPLVRPGETFEQRRRRRMATGETY